jgi:hypothetical protein
MSLVVAAFWRRLSVSAAPDDFVVAPSDDVVDPSDEVVAPSDELWEVVSSAIYCTKKKRQLLIRLILQLLFDTHSE